MRLLDLELTQPPDSLELELVVEGEPRHLEKLSVGMRATAILLLIFALEGRILILDQPEDDLDNRFVFEDIVGLLRKERGLTENQSARQIVTATHNANIPVLGDAELVAVLDAKGVYGKIQLVGSIDDRKVADEIRSLLEGGDEAFRRRAEKYGGIG